MRVWLILVGFTVLSLSYAQGCGAGLRPVEHDLGQTCVPERPQRVAAIDLDVVALMRLLEVRPVAHVGSFYSAWLAATPEWRGGRAFIEGSVDVGYPVNVERLLAAKPDLIITNDPENYGQLSAVAPTVVFDVYAGDSSRWADFTRYMADLLGTRAQAEMLIAQTDARIAALKEAYREAGAPTVPVIFYGEFGILSGAPYFAYNQVMAQAGILRPEAQSLDSTAFDAANETYWATLSEERLPLVDGDVLLMMLSQTPEELAFAAPLVEDVAADPLWGALNAVRQGRFYTVPYQRWISFDPYSVGRVIDDLFATVLATDPAEVAPNPFVSRQTEPKTAPVAGER